MTLDGLIEYVHSGRMEQHLSFLADDVSIEICNHPSAKIYSDHFQVIANTNDIKTAEKKILRDFMQLSDDHLIRLRKACNSIYASIGKPLESTACRTQPGRI